MQVDIDITKAVHANNGKDSASSPPISKLFYGYFSSHMELQRGKIYPIS